MARPHLIPAIDAMQSFIIVSVYPHITERDILTRHKIENIMRREGRPKEYFRLDKYSRGCVLYDALSQLGWEVYSRKNKHMIQAWIKPEVIRNDVR